MIGKGSIGMLNAKRRAAKRGWLLGTLFALVILVAPRLMPGNMALGPWVYPIIKGLVYPARLTERLPGDFLGNAHAGPSLLGMVLWFAVHFAFYGCVGSIVARLWVWYRVTTVSPKVLAKPAATTSPATCRACAPSAARRYDGRTEQRRDHNHQADAADGTP